MKIWYDPKLKQLARNLRNNSTLSEILFWNEVKRKQFGFQFYRQKPIGKFIVDFFCPDLKLVVEIDGDSHGHSQVKIKDDAKDKYLSSMGLTVLRYDDKAIKQELDQVINHLSDWIDLNKK